MDHQVAVGVAYGLAHRQEEAKPVVDFITRLVAVSVDGLPVDVFHDEIGASVVVASAVEEPRDARVVQRCQDAPFKAEAPQHLVRVHPALDLFDGHLLHEPVGLAFCEVDGAHAAPADFPHDAVGPDGARRVAGAQRRQ